MNNKTILIASATAYAKAFIDHHPNAIDIKFSIPSEPSGPDLLDFDFGDPFDDFHTDMVPIPLPQIRAYPIHDKKSGVNPAILHDLKADIDQVRSVINPNSWLLFDESFCYDVPGRDTDPLESRYW